MSPNSISTLPLWPNSVRPKLYSFRRCPYAMRSLLALWASGLEFDKQEVDLKQKPPELWVANHLGTVPVLLWEESGVPVVIAQSLEIMICALKANDPLSWLPQNQEGWLKALESITANDVTFKKHLDRYKYPSRYPQTSALSERDAGSLFLKNYERVLENQGFLSGERFGLLDAALAPFVRQFAKTDLLWFNSQRWPKLIDWLHAFEKSEAFSFIMQKS